MPTISYDNKGGRFGNQLFRYLTCMLIQCITGCHIFVTCDKYEDVYGETVTITDTNISDVLEALYIDPTHYNAKNIRCIGYFQRSKYFVEHREKLLEIIDKNKDQHYLYFDGKKYPINKYLYSEIPIKLRPDDVVISLRLDDFIQYPLMTSDIIAPQHYMHLLDKPEFKDRRVIIVCDKIRHNWEFKYLQHFKRWNPILVQNSLAKDFALLKGCKNLLHSNSTMCWLASFFSPIGYKTLRIIPQTYTYEGQSLVQIETADTIMDVRPLTHEQVHKLDPNDYHIFPLSYCVPDECIVSEIPRKSRLMAPLIPGNRDTYIYGKYQEKEYHDMYRSSRFAQTKRKGGWDCFRHYEILMNGCIPLFEKLQNCPNLTLTTYPKDLNEEAWDLYHNWDEDDPNCIDDYNELCEKYIYHTRKSCSASATAESFIQNIIRINNGKPIRNILMLSCNKGVSFSRETLWIGLKRYIDNIGGIAVEYEPISYLYDDFDPTSDHNYYNDVFFTFPARLKKGAHYNMPESVIRKKIKSGFWDLIIYGKVGPDEYCEFPWLDLVSSHNHKNKIAFILGGDEIYDYTITDRNAYNVNVCNLRAYYCHYTDYLNIYRQYGSCFVRELQM